jgi:iron(III) transport system permease protein
LLVGTSLVLAAAFAVPFGYLVWRNLSAPAKFLEVLTSFDTWRPIGRSLLLAVVVTALCVVIGVAMAWITMRTDLPFARAFRILIPLPLVLPSFVAGAALVAAFAPGGLLEELVGLVGINRVPEVRGFWGSVLALTVISYPYVFLPVAARLNQLSRSLEEAALMLGESNLSTFRRIVWPQIFSSVRAGALLVLLYVLSDFGVVALMGYTTVTVRMFNSWLANPELAFALGLILALVALLVVAGERVTSHDTLDCARAATSPHQHNLGRLKIPALFSASAVAVMSIVGPLSVLAWWVWRGIVNESAGFTGGDGLGGLWGPTWHTLSVALVTAAVAVLVVLPLARLAGRHRSRAALPALTFLVSGFALPGVVVALSVVFLVLRVDFLSGLYQTLPLLVFAYVVHFGAQAFRIAEVGMAAADRRLDEAAKTLGASTIRRFLRIELPLMRPVLSAGGGLVMLSTMKELPATLLASPLGFDTLATRVWNATADGFLADAGLAAARYVRAADVSTGDPPGRSPSLVPVAQFRW